MMTPAGGHRMALTSIFVTALMVGAIFSLRTIDIAGLPVPSGSLIFPLTFSALVVMAEVYGLPSSWRLALVGIMMLCLVIVFAAIVLRTPPGPDPGTHLFDLLFNVPIPVFTLAPLTFGAGEAVGLLLYRAAALRGHGRSLWFRLWLVPCASQVAASFLFLVTAALVLGGPVEDLPRAAAGRVAYPALYYLLMLPVTRAAIDYIRTHERPIPIPTPHYPEDLRG